MMISSQICPRTNVVGLYTITSLRMMRAASAMNSSFISGTFRSSVLQTIRELPCPHIKIHGASWSATFLFISLSLLFLPVLPKVCDNDATWLGHLIRRRWRTRWWPRLREKLCDAFLLVSRKRSKPLIIARWRATLVSCFHLLQPSVLIFFPSLGEDYKVQSLIIYPRSFYTNRPHPGICV